MLGSKPLLQVQAGTDVELLFLPIEAAAELEAQFPYLAEIGGARQAELKKKAKEGSCSQSFGGGGGATSPTASAFSDVLGFGSVAAAGVDGAGCGQSADLQGLDADLLSQRLSLMQASIVATGRDMRSRLDSLDRGVFEYLERRDAQNGQLLAQMANRVEALAQAIEHPQRAARSTRVAFAPRPDMASGAPKPSCNGSSCSGSAETRRGSVTTTSSRAGSVASTSSLGGPATAAPPQVLRVHSGMSTSSNSSTGSSREDRSRRPSHANCQGSRSGFDGGF